MAKICQICGRGTKTTLSRSHSNVGTKRKQYPNLQKAKINNKSQLVCVSCLKTITKKQPERTK